ncbi:MAG: lipocalin-like domain-containing protein [Acidimicrobiia bacterium]
MAGFLSYAGRYEVNDAARTVTHQIEMCPFPNWVGEAQVRHFQFDGSMLDLTTPPVAYGGDFAVGALVWERA